MTHRNPSQAAFSRITAFALAVTLSSSWSAWALATDPPPAAQRAASRHITLERATEIALREVPGGRVESVERDRWRGRPAYEVDLLDADGWDVEVVIDAENGKVLDRRTDD